MPNFSVERKVAEKFAGLTIGFVEGECSANSFSNAEQFQKEKENTQASAQAIVPLAEHPHIAAWRKAFKAFGADPTKTRSSAEAILRRLQKGEPLPSINAIVDIYNLISAKHVLPVGGQDAKNIEGSIVLRFAQEGENFLPLGASEPHKIDEGEVVYADEKKILCSKWNYRDCEPAKISGTTTKFVLFVDGAPGMEKSKVEAASADLATTLEKLVSGCKTSSRIFATS